MECLIDILESFNRKERFYLLAQALHGHGGSKNPRFQTSKSFRCDLGEAIGIHDQGIFIPSDAFVAMDYHLNWVHASLTLARNGGNISVEFPYSGGLVEQNQEDFDLLVAFPHGDDCFHLIFVEAKAYDSGGLEHFKKGQITSKVDRLNKILEEHNGHLPKVISHLCLLSGYEQSNFDGLPHILRPDGDKYSPAWLRLNLPSEKCVLRLPKSDSAYTSRVSVKKSDKKMRKSRRG